MLFQTPAILELQIFELKPFQKSEAKFQLLSSNNRYMSEICSGACPQTALHEAKLHAPQTSTLSQPALQSQCTARSAVNSRPRKCTHSLD